MILYRTTAPYTVDVTATVLEALRRISANKARVAFVLDEHGTVRGTLSDGDIRRWLVEHTAPDLAAPTLAPTWSIAAADLHPPDLDGRPLGFTLAALDDTRALVVALAISTDQQRSRRPVARARLGLGRVGAYAPGRLGRV